MGGIVHFTGRSGGATFDACLRFADVRQLRQAGWKVIYTQAVKPDPNTCGKRSDRAARSEDTK